MVQLASKQLNLSDPEAGEQIRESANVDEGATKGSIIKRIIKPGTPTVGKGYAVVSDDGYVKLANSDNLASSKHFVGIIDASTTAGNNCRLIASGPVDRDIINLGNGEAVAVGVNSSGVPVRVTDITLATPLNYIGFCDTAGTITIAPKIVERISVEDYGGRADYIHPSSGTDISIALKAAIRAIDPIHGGRVRIGPGLWRVSQTIDVDRRVIIEGDGPGDTGNALNYGTTTLIADPGVTALRFWSNSQHASDDPDANGSGGSILSGIRIVASGYDNNTYIGNYTAGGTGTITSLTTPNDIVNGQLIEIPGAGTAAPMARVTATTTNGSAVVTITGPDQGSYQGLHVGCWIRIEGAFGGNKVRIVTIPEPEDLGELYSFSITVSQTASASVSGVQLIYIPAAIARVRSGGGTATLQLDYAQGEDTTGVIISHADAGIHVMSSITIRDVVVGLANFDFKGPGILISASSGWNPVPGYNANCWRIDACRTYGNRGGLVVQGQDANAGLATMLNCTGSPISGQEYWCILDQSGLGNTYVGCHVLGGYGFFTTGDDTIGATIAIGCYRESGTFNSFGVGANVFGGSMSVHAGGSGWVGQRVNRMIRGRTDGGSGAAFSKIMEIFDPDIGIMYRGEVPASGTENLIFRPSKPGDGLPVNCYTYMWEHSSGQGRTPFQITDTNSTWPGQFFDPGWAKGQGLLWRGVWLGGGNSILGGIMSDIASNLRYLGNSSHSPPSGFRDWFRGDRLFNDRIETDKNWIDHWVCTTGSNIGTYESGTWTAVPLVTRQTALTAEDDGVINTGDATTDDVIENMRTRIAELEAKLTAANILES